MINSAPGRLFRGAEDESVAKDQIPDRVRKNVTTSLAGCPPNSIHDPLPCWSFECFSYQKTRAEALNFGDIVPKIAL